jgi:hypothetical protein
MMLYAIEDELGFQIVEVFELLGDYSSSWNKVAAKIIGEADIVFRLSDGPMPTYQHRRLGVTENFPNNPPRWHAISQFSQDIKQILSDAALNADEVNRAIGILPRKADIRFDCHT